MNDLRFAFRQLRQRPGFAAVAVVTLALGIGANTALFSVVKQVLLSPLPFGDSGRLMLLRETDVANQIEQGSVSGPNYLDWCERSRSFAALAAADFGSRFNLSGRGEPVSLRGARVAPSFFEVFTIPLRLGRPFRADESEPGKSRVVILGYGLWQRFFGGRTDVIGQTVTLDGEPHEVVGVTGRSLAFVEEMIEAYAPIPLPQLQANRGNHHLLVFGRLRPEVSVEQAGAELRAVAAAIAAEYPELQGTRSARLFPLQEYLVEAVRPAFLVLHGAVALVLVIACANVANLLLARGETRTREIAVRAALGAGRRRLLRQLLTESLLLALAGGLAGLALAQVSIHLLQALAPKTRGGKVPFFDEIGLDGQVLLFTLGVTLLTGLLFGLVPAWNAARVGVSDALKAAARGSFGSRQRHRLLNAFVVAQIALSVVLLAGAGLLVRSLGRLVGVNPGFTAERLLTMQTELSHPRYTNEARRLQFYQTVLETVRAVPGVESAEVINILPMNNQDSDWSFDIEGTVPLPPGKIRLAQYRVVSPGYFDTLRIPLVRGRSFAPSDQGRQRVAIVNEALVRHYFPGQNLLGRRLRFGDGEDLEIVGVVADVRHFGLGQATPPTVYQPITQDCWSLMSLAIRTHGDPQLWARPVQEQIWGLHPDQPVTNVRPMEEWLRESISVERFCAQLLASFALVGLALAMVGIYGVLAYAVSQRTQEIGVRMALGANVREILRLVVRRGMCLTLMGLGIGGVGAVAVTRLMRGLLYQTSPADPLTFGVVLLCPAVVALLASWVPARRAAQIDPVVALRCE